MMFANEITLSEFDASVKKIVDGDMPFVRSVQITTQHLVFDGNIAAAIQLFKAKLHYKRSTKVSDFART